MTSLSKNGRWHHFSILFLVNRTFSSSSLLEIGTALPTDGDLEDLLEETDDDEELLEEDDELLEDLRLSGDRLFLLPPSSSEESDE